VRGTEFLVFEDDKTGTEVIVLEGSVEMKGIKGEKTIIINASYKVIVTKDGILSNPEKIDLTKMDKWWER
jgi:ferric-dicitrate binding protein FerR (iron transport regulator)